MKDNVKMPSFTNPLHNECDELGIRDQGIDIIDYETVVYDKAGGGTRTSLSLNIYKYEKILEPNKANETSTDEEMASSQVEEHPKKDQSDLKTLESNIKHVNSTNRNDSKKMYFLWLFISMASVCCISLLVLLTSKVFGNSTTGKLKRT
jgi:hypothetical protein